MKIEYVRVDADGFVDLKVEGQGVLSLRGSELSVEIRDCWRW